MAEKKRKKFKQQIVGVKKINWSFWSLIIN